MAILEQERLLGEVYQNSGQTHSRTLLKMAEDLLCNCGLEVADLDAVAVAAGRGALPACASEWRRQRDFAGGRLPLYGVSTLESMARFLRSDGISGVCGNGRQTRARSIQRLFLGAGQADQAAAGLRDFHRGIRRRFKSAKNRKFWLEMGATLCYNTLGSFLTDLTLAPEHLRLQRASGVALAALEQIKRRRCAFRGATNAQLPAAFPGGAGTSAEINLITKRSITMGGVHVLDHRLFSISSPSCGIKTLA